MNINLTVWVILLTCTQTDKCGQNISRQTAAEVNTQCHSKWKKEKLRASVGYRLAVYVQEEVSSTEWKVQLSQICLCNNEHRQTYTMKHNIAVSCFLYQHTCTHSWHRLKKILNNIHFLCFQHSFLLSNNKPPIEILLLQMPKIAIFAPSKNWGQSPRNQYVH